MSKKIESDKFFMVSQPDNYGCHETYEEAEERARQRAWNEGQDYFVMAPIAKANAPEEINTVKVSKL